MQLNEKIESLLKEKNIPYRFVPLPEDLPMDVPSHAAFHGITMAHAIATIVYRTEKGIIGAVKRSDTKIDEEKLKSIAGVAQLTFASKEDLSALGTEVGLVPYLGLPIPYYVDEKVLSVGKAYGTGGTKTMGMAMEASDLLKVNHGTVGDFTVFENYQEAPMGKRLYSAITPSGDGTLHIGNYLGAVKQFIELAKTNECFFQLATIHALTTIQDKKKLAGNIETLTLNELALLGENPNIYFCYQSDISYHTELQSILNNVTPLGLVKRAHAYKDKLAKDVMEDEINLGLFSYPILMAADILVYKTQVVPVGRDQKQHVEIARDVADRFNKTFQKNIFPLPEPYIPEETAVILGTDGKRKMSKSLGNIISLFEDEAVIKKQVNGTYTDPTRKHATDRGHIEGNMVFTYLEHFGDAGKVDELKRLYVGGKVGDVEVKEYLFASLMKTFGPARERYKELRADKKKIQKILARGRERALSVAGQTMQEVRDAVGLTNQYSFFSYISLRHPELVSGSKTMDAGSGSGMTEKDGYISIDEFAKVELRVGKVVEATHPEKSEKLIRLVVDIGQDSSTSSGLRTIFTGVRLFGYTRDDFLGKQFFFVTNLAPRKMPSYVKTSEGTIVQEESQGMILAVNSIDNKPLFVSAEGMPIGARIR